MSVRRACHSARAPSSGVVGTLHGPAIDFKSQYQTTTGTVVEAMANLSTRGVEQTPHTMTPEWRTFVKGVERAEAHVNKLGEEAEQRVAAQFAKLVTAEPLKDPISKDEVDAYLRARGRFKSMLGFYEGNQTGLYPLEERYIGTFVNYFPMSKDKKRIMQNRRTEIQAILRGQSRPARNIADNLEYVNLLDEYTKYIGKILKF